MTLLLLFAGGGASGAQSLTLPFLADGDTLYAPSVAPGAVALSLPFITSGDVLYAPAVSLVGGAQSLALPFLADGNALFAPIIWQETATADAQIIFRRRRRWMSR